MRSNLCSLVAGLSLAAATAAAVPAQTITGRVVDAATRQPIAEVSVRLMAGERLIATTTSDGNGSFILSSRDAGRFRLIASRLGYAEAQSQILDIAAGESINAQLQMSVEAVKLAPIALEAPRDPYLASTGFYDRMQAGTGDFLTGDQIRRRNTHSIVDILRGMRGVKIQRLDRRNEVYMSGANCLPQVVVDGITIRYGGSSTGTRQALDEIISGAHVDGIEVYRGGSGVPPEFMGPNAGCGVIVIWTRHK